MIDDVGAACPGEPRYVHEGKNCASVPHEYGVRAAESRQEYPLRRDCGPHQNSGRSGEFPGGGGGARALLRVLSLGFMEPVIQGFLARINNRNMSWGGGRWHVIDRMAGDAQLDSSALFARVLGRNIVYQLAVHADGL